jgi:diacylglycerol O-acyltransferase
MDQASYFWVRASGHVHCVQATWVYERAIDFDGLRTTLGNLAHGLLGRRIERSPLPFGRDRWVSWHDSPTIDVAVPVGSLDAVEAWAEERARVPIDPEVGPGWHVGVLPIEQYGTAVSVVASHSVIDGLGLTLVLADAANGIRHDFGYPAPRSRTRRQALAQDARLTATGLPGVGRALLALPKLARKTDASPAGANPGRPRATSETGPDRPVDVPTATVYIDVAAWDARVEALGGTSNSLFAGFAAKLAERSGRIRDDGMVTLTYPVSDRTENDTRANALKSVELAADPTSVTADLRNVRAEIKRALTLGLGNFGEQEALLPLIPFVPLAVAKRVPPEAGGAAQLPVGCSNLGSLDAAVARVDGTASDYLSVRLVEQNLTIRSPELRYGELHITSGRVCSKVFLAVRAYEPGRPNSRARLGELLASTLAEFELSGTFI